MGSFLSQTCSLKTWQNNFIRLPPTYAYKYALVIVCSPCRWKCSPVVLSAKIIPLWGEGVPKEIHSNRGIHLTGASLAKLLSPWPITQQLHCACHPQSSGMVERVNVILKTSLAKFSEGLSILWPKVLL